MIDVAAYYRFLPRLPAEHPGGGGAAHRVLDGAPMRNIAPCGACHGDARGSHKLPAAPGSRGSPPPTHVKAQLESLRHRRPAQRHQRANAQYRAADDAGRNRRRREILRIAGRRIAPSAWPPGPSPLPGQGRHRGCGAAAVSPRCRRRRSRSARPRPGPCPAQARRRKPPLKASPAPRGLDYRPDLERRHQLRAAGGVVEAAPASPSRDDGGLDALLQQRVHAALRALSGESTLRCPVSSSVSVSFGVT